LPNLIEAAPGANRAVGGLAALPGNGRQAPTGEVESLPRILRHGVSLVMCDWAKGEPMAAVCLVDCLEMRGLCFGYGDHAKFVQ